MARLRTDIIVTETAPPASAARGGRAARADAARTQAVLLKVPETGAVFTFGPEEYFLLQALETHPDPAAARAAFADRFGAAIEAGAHAAFLEDAWAAGLLTDQPTAPPTPPPESPRTRARPAAPTASPAPRPSRSGPGRPPARHVPAAEDDADWDLPPDRALEATDPDAAEALDTVPGTGIGQGRVPRQPARWTLFNPNRVLGGLAVVSRPFRHAVWLLPVLVPLAVLTLLNHQSDFDADIARAFSSLSVGLTLLLSLFLVNLTSKVLQGTVCRGFGGDMHEFGIRLAFGLLPRFFVDKGQIRRLPRRARLWCYAAPLLMKLALFSVGVLAWVWLRPSGSVLSEFALILSQFGIAAFLFTANPLWRADGYLFLTTVYDQPRLRENAFALLRLWLTFKPAPAALSAGQRWALLSFATGIVLFTTVLVGAVLVKLAITLESELQGLGVLLFLLAVALLVGWVLAVSRNRRDRAESRRAARTEARLDRRATTPNGDRAAAPAKPDRPPPPRAVPARPRPSPLRRWGGRAVTAGLLAGAAYVATLPYPYETGGPVTLQPITKAEARAQVDGEVIAVHVTEGEWVEQGQVLAVLGDRDEQHALAVARAGLDEARADLRLLEEGASTEEVARAEARVRTAEVAARFALTELERARDLVRADVIAPARFDRYQVVADEADARLAEARAILNKVKEPARASELEAARAEVRRLEEDVRFMEGDLAATRVRAPVAGLVISPDLQRRIGTYLAEGALFAELENSRELEATIEVPETDILDVQVGDLARFKLWSDSQRLRVGEVVGIAPVAEERDFGRVVRVTTRLDNADGGLRSGLTGYAKIAVGEKPVWDAFGRLLIRFVTIEMWSWIP